VSDARSHVWQMGEFMHFHCPPVSWVWRALLKLRQIQGYALCPDTIFYLQDTVQMCSHYVA
jgi:hypothetical protein